MSTRYVTASAAVTPAFQTVRRSVLGALAGTLAVLGLLAFAAPANGQTGGASELTQPFELRPFAGAFIGTGNQRELVDNAFLTGLQGSWRISPAVALTGTFGWSPNRDRQIVSGERLDIFQYDVGVEARAASLVDNGTFDFSPFIGAGLGGRTYSYRDFDADSKTHFNGYGAVGGDLGYGRVGLRVEARDYVSRYTPLDGIGDTEARNDIALAAGLYLRF